MILKQLKFQETHSFTTLFLEYIQQKDSLKNFYGKFASPSNFKEQIEDKIHFSAERRKVLVEELKNQYRQLEACTKVTQNIASLADAKTFTITTGHQLNIFTGPLYFIYKIITVINACKELKAAYPAYHFVPVYWMASEDHDYEEIKSFWLYGKKYEWQTKQRGAVGRFHTKELKTLIDEIPGETRIFREAYTKSENLSQAVLHYVNALFGDEGLVVINADNRSFKKLLTPVITDDLFGHQVKKMVDVTTQKLQSLGYHTQVNARDINFFYLAEGLRARIEKVDEGFKIADTALTFSKEQIQQMITNEPEKFSPNVILRPLYQEIILPNLAYCGGPAELTYWLQLKGVFERYQQPFPILLPRSFALIISQPIFRKFEKTGLDIADLFDTKNQLFNRWVLKNSTRLSTFEAEQSSIHRVFDKIKQQASYIDFTLVKHVEAEAHRAIKSIQNIEKKLVSAEKKFHADKLSQLETVKDALFPRGVLQERVDNFLNFYQADPDFIKKVATQLNPFNFQFNVLIYE